MTESYTQQTWANDAEGGTPLSADRMNYMEAGIAGAYGGTLDAEAVQDIVGAMFVEGAGIDLTYDDAGNIETIGVSSGYAPSLANLPAGTTVTVQKSGGGVWPVRPTARSDVYVIWKGPDPDPSIVSSGTSGMLNNVDSRFVTP